MCYGPKHRTRLTSVANPGCLSGARGHVCPSPRSSAFHSTAARQYHNIPEKYFHTCNSKTFCVPSEERTYTFAATGLRKTVPFFKYYTHTVRKAGFIFIIQGYQSRTKTVDWTRGVDIISRRERQEARGVMAAGRSASTADSFGCVLSRSLVEAPPGVGERGGGAHNV